MWNSFHLFLTVHVKDVSGLFGSKIKYFTWVNANALWHGEPLSGSHQYLNYCQAYIQQTACENDSELVHLGTNIYAGGQGAGFWSCQTDNREAPY